MFNQTSTHSCSKFLEYNKYQRPFSTPMPPDFEKLPKPIDEEINNFEDEEDENEIIRLFTEENKNSNNISITSSSIENSILEKINEQ